MKSKEDLYHSCYEAWRWAEEVNWNTKHKPGSNDWMAVFVDKLHEELYGTEEKYKEEG